MHQIRSWLDLKHRLAHDRRCFALCHAALPREPLVVLHVALTNEISDSVDTLIKRRDSASRRAPLDRNVSTAIFYSITSTQSGLKVSVCVFVSFSSMVVRSSLHIHMLLSLDLTSKISVHFFHGTLCQKLFS